MFKHKKTYHRLIVALIIITLLNHSCGTTISTQVIKTYNQKKPDSEIIFLGINDSKPDDFDFLGEIKINYSLLQINCNGYNNAIELAKGEARKIGGNVIKINEHYTPTNFQCHRIKAEILRVEDISEIRLEKRLNVEEEIANEEYAILKFYKFGKITDSAYDIYLADSIVCRVNPVGNFKKTVKINSYGRNMLWIGNLARFEIPINIKKGNTYYIRLEKLVYMEVVDNKIGKTEFESFNVTK